MPGGDLEGGIWSCYTGTLIQDNLGLYPFKCVYFDLHATRTSHTLHSSPLTLRHVFTASIYIVEHGKLTFPIFDIFPEIIELLFCLMISSFFPIFLLLSRSVNELRHL